MRYVGQAYELAIDWPTLKPDEMSIVAMEGRFHEEHNRRYSYDMKDREIELVSMRVTATAFVEHPSEAELGTNKLTPEPKTKRQVYFNNLGSIDCAVYDRGNLGRGDRLQGPVLIEQRDATTLLPPNWSLSVDPSGHLILNFI